MTALVAFGLLGWTCAGAALGFALRWRRRFNAAVDAGVRQLEPRACLCGRSFAVPRESGQRRCRECIERNPIVAVPRGAA